MMYARVVRFALTTGDLAPAQAIADDLAPEIKKQPGCEEVIVFGDAKDGEAGLFVLWDTQEHADAAAVIIRPKLEQHLAGKIKSPPDARLFDVLSK
jgi:quinol monooxygenase YgiN